MIHIDFGFSLGKVYCTKFHHCRICVTDSIFKIFGKGGEPYMGGLYGEHFIET